MITNAAAVRLLFRWMCGSLGICIHTASPIQMARQENTDSTQLTFQSTPKKDRLKSAISFVSSINSTK
jgi:hypothetical protein